ncbi:hypothetical protein R3P38DRAFT_3354695 [Favolaschia claudopus]|uniref:Uncharacterized protein n=1 Tax=Favolaschia claudopus TaxID=2862362 RepID=A0AAW0BN85_9AGAR
MTSLCGRRAVAIDEQRPSEPELSAMWWQETEKQPGRYARKGILLVQSSKRGHVITLALDHHVRFQEPQQLARSIWLQRTRQRRKRRLRGFSKSRGSGAHLLRDSGENFEGIGAGMNDKWISLTHPTHLSSKKIQMYVYISWSLQTAAESLRLLKSAFLHFPEKLRFPTRESPSSGIGGDSN